MLINIAVCDDDRLELDRIKNEINKSADTINVSVDMFFYTDGNTVVDLICNNKENFDILFLDIDMPNITGLEVAKKIRNANSNILLIFVSAHEQYVFESIEYNPFRYIRKSRLHEEMLPALKASYAYLQSEIQESIIVKIENGEVRIRHSDIMYFEVNSRKIEIFTSDEKSFFTRSTIKELYSELENENFIQINSGCVVNAKYINAYSSIDITLDNGKKLFVSRRRLKELKARISKYWSDKI